MGILHGDCSCERPLKACATSRAGRLRTQALEHGVVGQASERERERKVFTAAIANRDGCTHGGTGARLGAAAFSQLRALSLILFSTAAKAKRTTVRRAGGAAAAACASALPGTRGSTHRLPACSACRPRRSGCSRGSGRAAGRGPPPNRSGTLCPKAPSGLQVSPPGAGCPRPARCSSRGPAGWPTGR